MKQYRVVSSLKEKGFPTSSPKYREAHSEASTAEKKKYPAGYQKLKRLDKKVPQGQLIGKNLKSGKVEVSKRVPKPLRGEVAFHEKFENKAIKRLSK